MFLQGFRYWPHPPHPAALAHLWTIPKHTLKNRTTYAIAIMHICILTFLPCWHPCSGPLAATFHTSSVWLPNLLWLATLGRFMVFVSHTNHDKCISMHLPERCAGYIPPETFLSHFWVPKGDIFSAGVMFYQILSGMPVARPRAAMWSIGKHDLTMSSSFVGGFSYRNVSLLLFGTYLHHLAPMNFEPYEGTTFSLQPIAASGGGLEGRISEIA